MTTASAIHEASQCPNVTGWDHTDGQGNTQKAISDLSGLAARGVNAIVVFPDAGPALGMRLISHTATPGGLTILELEATGPAAFASYAGVGSIEA